MKKEGGGTVADEALDATVLDLVAGEAPLERGAALGRYIVIERVGAGGMGVVYAAYDPELDRKIAVKLLRGVDSAGSNGRTRLLREAQAMARLAHPNVIHVYDVGTIGEQVFVAMELIDGVSLRKWVEGRSSDEILGMYRQAARGLEAAHAAGLVHRDFKPDNVLVGSDGRARVLDFGLARVAQEAASSEARRAANPTALTTPLTRTGAFMGTPAYMAPEQIAGDPVDAKCDQFAFCVALYEALYGERPYGGDNVDQLVENIRAGRVREAPPGRTVTPALRAALLRGIAADREARHPSMAALLDAIGSTPAPRRARLVGAAALALILLAVVVGWIQTRRSATTRVKRAQELGQEVQKIRSSMRAAHLLPLHDIKADRDRVRVEMKRIETQMHDLGEEARGPGEFALGTAWFSIGDRDQARQHLESAWAAGERNPDLAYELGLVLAKTYERAVLDRPPLDEKKQKAREDELNRTLRDPAIAYLRQASGATDTSPAYVEAVIAFYERRWEDARTRGEIAFGEAPTLYEAGLLVANVDSKLADHDIQTGDRKAAEARFARAEAMYRRVVEIGRSDELVYRQYGDYLGVDAYRHTDTGEDTAARLQAVLALCGQGQRADSETPWPDEMAARTHWMMGANDKGQKRDPRPQYRQTIEVAERVLKKHPRSVKALMFRGGAWLTLAEDWEVPHGLDPRASLKAAIDSLDAMLAITPDVDAFIYAGTAHGTLARWQCDHGIDASAAVDAAVARNDEALRSDPEVAGFSYENSCLVLAQLAHDQLTQGIDPGKLLDRAEPYCAGATKAAPGMSDALDAAGERLTVKGGLAARSGGDPLPLWQRAETALAAAVKLEPQREDIRSDVVFLAAERAEYLAAQGKSAAADLSRALSEARTAVRTNAESATAQCALATAELAAARINRDPKALLEGEKAADRAIAIKPDDVAALMVAAELRLIEGRPAEGLAWVARGLAINPTHPRFLLLRSAFERRAGDSAHADADRDAALKARPLLANDPILAKAN